MPLLLDDELVDAVGTGDPPVDSPALPRPKLLIAMEVFLSSKMRLRLQVPIRLEMIPLERKVENWFVTSDLAGQSAPE